MGRKFRRQTTPRKRQKVEANNAYHYYNSCNNKILKIFSTNIIINHQLKSTTLFNRIQKVICKGVLILHIIPRTLCSVPDDLPPTSLQRPTQQFTLTTRIAHYIVTPI